MAEKIQENTKYRWIGISIVSVALLGWLLALYFWSASTEAETNLERQIALNGEATELEARIVTLRSEVTQTESAREARTSELATLEPQLVELQQDVRAAEDQAQVLREERDALEAENATLGEQRDSLQNDIEEAQSRVTETAQELSDVGERLEQARTQEAEIQASISGLTADVARLTEEASGAENRVQTAREAEASLEQRVAAARTDLEEIKTERDTVSQAADTLVERRDALANETQQAETQMKNLQEQLVQLSEDLAERSNALAEVEAGIADQQREAGQPARAAASGFILGERYEYGPLQRAWQTAQAIAALRPDLEIQPAPLLAERDWGIWEGAPRAMLDRDATPEGGESPEAFHDRILQGCAAISGPAAQEAPPLIVAHSGTIRSVMAALDLPFLRPMNCARITIFRDPRGCWCADPPVVVHDPFPQALRLS